MKINICILATVCMHTIVHAQTGMYSTKVETHTGAVRDVADFRGKNLLIVCLDPAGRPADQLVEYRQLAKQFKDSGLVVLIFPVAGDSSATVAGSKKSTSLLQHYYSDEDFIVCAVPDKKSRNGTLYKWLFEAPEQQLIAEKPGYDGWKYLINRQGRLCAVFSRRVRPMDIDIIETLQNNH